MGNIATTEERWGGGDYRWLASATGFDRPESGTTDNTQFDAEDHYPNGYLPSGTRVTLDAGTGLLEPYDEDTADLTTLYGFIAHDEQVRGAKTTVAVLRDATVIAQYLPGDTDLTDGRYICNQVDQHPAPETEGGGG